MRRQCCYLVILLVITGCSKNTPGWQLETLDPATQQTHTLLAREATGKRIFINYWAEWCKPCIAEMPELNDFAHRQGDRVIVLGFNFDRKQGTGLVTAMQKVTMAFPATLTDPASVFALPEVSGLPTTLVLDEQGRLITALMGPQTTATLEEALSIP